MSNTFFQFKQFTVHQGKCAMKVCTDACVFGAWIADKLQNEEEPLRILDIGTGTGLLTLMLAQKANALFTSVEIDDLAFEQASQNFSESKWRDKISIHHDNIVSFSSSAKFDFIISNPPFYENDLKSHKKNINFARHDSSLTLSALLQTCNQLLTQEGAIALLLPFHRLQDLQKEAAANNFFITELLQMKQTPVHNFFRIGAVLKRTPADIRAENITIKNAAQQYSEDFINLLKDYYLHL